MTATAARRPEATEYAPFYAGYVALVPEDDVVTRSATSGDEITARSRPFPESRGGFRYADGQVVHPRGCSAT